jgi:hypothetical protein
MVVGVTARKIGPSFHLLTAMPETSPPLSPRAILALIFGGLLLWGLYISAGVLWNGINPLRALVLIVCVGLFLSFWGVLLRGRKQP